MKKKLLLGLSGLTLLNGETSLLDNLEPEIIDQQDYAVEELKTTAADEKIIKDFYEEIKYTSIITSLGKYSLKSYKLVKTNVKNHKIVYELESEYKKISLYFPVEYSNNKLERIIPIYYDAKKKEMSSYEMKAQIKPLKQSTVDSIFPKSTRMILNNPSKASSEKIVFLEPESVDSMDYLRNMYNEDMITLKDEYKNIKVVLVLLPLNYYSEKNSLQISALMKEYYKIFGNIDIYLEHIEENKKVLKNVRTKYLEIFKENYANDFIVEMYKEISEKMEMRSDYFLMKLIKQVEQRSKEDIIVSIKKEQDFVEGIMKLDFVEDRMFELMRNTSQDVYTKVDLEDEE